MLVKVYPASFQILHETLRGCIHLASIYSMDDTDTSWYSLYAILDEMYLSNVPIYNSIAFVTAIIREIIPVLVLLSSARHS